MKAKTGSTGTAPSRQQLTPQIRKQSGKQDEKLAANIKQMEARFKAKHG